MLTNTVLAFSVVMVVLYQFFFKKETDRIDWKEMTFVCICFASFVFIFLYYTGILTSGYHFVDDHEIYTINNNISRHGFFGAIYETLKRDMTETHRYRFTYFLIRVVQCAVLRDHMMSWHVIYGVLSTLNLILGYYYARRRGYPMILSFLFCLMILIGCDQSAVIWRLGPQENLGMMLLLLTLISVRRLYETKSRKWFILSAVLMFFLAGIKESFLLLLPSVPVLFLLWHLEEEKLSGQTIRQLWKDYGFFWIYTGVVFILSMVVVFKVAGTGYGMDSSFTVKDYIGRFKEIYQNNLKRYIDLASVAALCGCIAVAVRKKHIAYYLIALALTAGDLLLQCVLYAKGLMWERYLIPSTFIVAVFAFLTVGRIVLKSKVFLSAYQVIIASLCVTMLFTTNIEIEAGKYATDGHDTTNAINTLADLYDGGNVLTDLGFEKDFSAAARLQGKYQISNVYNVRYTGTTEDGKYRDTWHPETEEEYSISFSEAKYVLTDPYSSLLPLIDKKYKSIQFGEYTLHYIDEDQ